jgi:hypothetical protein
MERLPYISRLCLVVNVQGPHSFARPTGKVFTALMHALKDIQERQVVSPAAHSGHITIQEANSNRPSPVCAKDPLVLVPRTLRELVLTVPADGLDRFTMLAPYLSTLTDLRLRQIHGGTLHVGLVMQICPQLRVLHLAAHCILDLPAPWLAPPLDSNNLATTTDNERPPPDCPLDSARIGEPTVHTGGI